MESGQDKSQGRITMMDTIDSGQTGLTGGASARQLMTLHVMPLLPGREALSQGNSVQPQGSQR
jgi:hypothetical protein